MTFCRRSYAPRPMSAIPYATQVLFRTPPTSAIARVTYATREICLRSRTRPVPEDLSQTNGIPTTECERLTLTPNERVYILRLARLVRDHHWPCVQRFRSTYDYEECLEDG